MATAQEAEQIVRGLTGKLPKRRDGGGPRFVFELLRNFEDKPFTKATAEGSPPFISFRIYPNRIIVDCNEDGLTKSDLEAICAVGKDDDSINETGFRSIFTVASRVHIQSGNFSFELQHDNIDTDAGMMRPIWITPARTLPSPLTRMTLYLHDQGDEENADQLKSIISSEFGNLQETTLLFLHKLQAIIVEFYDDGGKLDRSKRSHKQQFDEYRFNLKTISIKSGAEMIQDQIYHVTDHQATGLKPGINCGSSTAEVILAFPLSSDYKPLVKDRKQQIFALSPIRSSDYAFHIHSDFDVNTNQQDIVLTSRRNLEIRDWISNAFHQAILQFRRHPTLCYDWPLFLPSPADSYDNYWSRLNQSIKRVVQENKIVKGRTWTALRRLDDVIILPDFAQDEDGQPLLDTPVLLDPFISSNYTATAISILEDYGLKKRMTRLGFLNLLQVDLNSNRSRMYRKDNSIEWHSAMAGGLLAIWGYSSRVDEKLKSLPILALRDGTWTSIAAGPVYFPTTNDINIPESLDLRVLSLTACSNPNRRALFQRLGALEATVDQVRESIMQSYASSMELLLVDIQSYLHYLYLTHETGLHKPEDYSKVQIMDSCWNHMSPHNKVVYLPGTDHSYSPESLWFAQSKSSNLPAFLLHPDLLDDVPTQPRFFHPTWKIWLREYIGVRERLSILSSNCDDLSDTFLYVLEHRPAMFLDFFQHLSIHNMAKLLERPALVTKIQDLPAKALCGVDFAIRLQDTWLPLAGLKQTVERYIEHPGQFPFLKVEDATVWNLATKWNFLSQYFSVGKFENMDFLLEILRCMRISRPEPQKVFHLYVAISAKLAISEDQEVMQKKIRTFFEDEVIFAPYEEEPMWTSSSSCLWAAPSDMVTANSLQSLYKEQTLSDDDRKIIENLFSRTLGIRDARMSDLMTELDALREEECEDFCRILDLYRYLDEKIVAPTDMRAAFEESPLIFVEQQGVSGWYTTSDCLWSSTIAVRGKVTLDESYGELGNFFVNKLGVISLTPQLVYDELRHSSQRNAEETKMALLALNEFLETTPIHLDPEPIGKARVFPVRNPDGTVVLSSIDVDFAIGDRDPLRAKFEDKISVLDFDLGHVRRLKPLIDWLGLKDRLLSRCVEGSTSVSSNVELPISSTKRNLKYKAYHIARVAATFSSPRFLQNASLLYDQLRTMRVIEVDQMSSVLRINQNGQTFEANTATASGHITEFVGTLTIYVPREQKAQAICFGSTLPRQLAAWLMRDPESHEDRNVDIEAVNALTSIFASERYVLDDILENLGIIQVSFENMDENEIDGDEEDDEDAEEDEEFFNALETGDTSLEQENTPTDSSKDDHSSPEPPRGLTLTEICGISQQKYLTLQAQSGFRNVSPALSTSSTVSSSEDAEYREILCRVIAAARTADLPLGGTFDVKDLQNALSEDADNETQYESYNGLSTTLTINSMEQWERIKRIGAAGQLYVFELLSKLNLPGWKRENWQSSIRMATTIHPKYTNMPKSTRKVFDDEGFGDLIYMDFEGQLTRALIDAGLLIRHEWSEKRPKYHIFVRTTTGPCETPICVMEDQYKRMEHMSFKHNNSEVCLIFRVYSLLNIDKINHSVYLDLEQLKTEKRLLLR